MKLLKEYKKIKPQKTLDKVRQSMPENEICQNKELGCSQRNRATRVVMNSRVITYKKYSSVRQPESE